MLNNSFMIQNKSITFYLLLCYGGTGLYDQHRSNCEVKDVQLNSVALNNFHKDHRQTYPFKKHFKEQKPIINPKNSKNIPHNRQDVGINLKSEVKDDVQLISPVVPHDQESKQSKDIERKNRVSNIYQKCDKSKAHTLTIFPDENCSFNNINQIPETKNQEQSNYINNDHNDSIYELNITNNTTEEHKGENDLFNENIYGKIKNIDHNMNDKENECLYAKINRNKRHEPTIQNQYPQSTKNNEISNDQSYSDFYDNVHEEDDTSEYDKQNENIYESVSSFVYYSPKIEKQTLQSVRFLKKLNTDYESLMQIDSSLNKMNNKAIDLHSKFNSHLLRREFNTAMFNYFGIYLVYDTDNRIMSLNFTKIYDENIMSYKIFIEQHKYLAHIRKSIINDKDSKLQTQYEYLLFDMIKMISKLIQVELKRRESYIIFDYDETQAINGLIKILSNDSEVNIFLTCDQIVQNEHGIYQIFLQPTLYKKYNLDSKVEEYHIDKLLLGFIYENSDNYYKKNYNDLIKEFCIWINNNKHAIKYLQSKHKEYILQSIYFRKVRDQKSASISWPSFLYHSIYQEKADMFMQSIYHPKNPHCIYIQEQNTYDHIEIDMTHDIDQNKHVDNSILKNIKKIGNLFRCKKNRKKNSNNNKESKNIVKPSSKNDFMFSDENGQDEYYKKSESKKIQSLELESIDPEYKNNKNNTNITYNFDFKENQMQTLFNTYNNENAIKFNPVEIYYLLEKELLTIRKNRISICIFYISLMNLNLNKYDVIDIKQILSMFEITDNKLENNAYYILDDLYKDIDKAFIKYKDKNNTLQTKLSCIKSVIDILKNNINMLKNISNEADSNFFSFNSHLIKFVSGKYTFDLTEQNKNIKSIEQKLFLLKQKYSHEFDDFNSAKNLRCSESNNRYEPEITTQNHTNKDKLYKSIKIRKEQNELLLFDIIDLHFNLKEKIKSLYLKYIAN